MKYLTVLLLIAPVLLRSVIVGAQEGENWWNLTVNQVSQESELQDVSMTSYFPDSGDAFLVVETTLTDVMFDASTSLPDSGMLLQGIHFYEGNVPASIHAFALADVSVVDSSDTSFGIYAFSIGSDLLIAPNLDDFSVAAPYEEVGYTFVFAVPAARINEAFVFTFEGIPVAEIAAGQAADAAITPDAEPAEGEPDDDPEPAAAAVDDHWWDITVVEIRQENELQDIFLSSYYPEPGETFLVVETTLKDMMFDPGATLPDSETFIQGVRLYEGDMPPDVHAFALADVVVVDASGESYSLYAFAIYSDIHIAPNLNDFSVAAPYEEVNYTFVFAVPSARINEVFAFSFDGVVLGEVAPGQSLQAAADSEVSGIPTATFTPIEPARTSTATLTSTPTATFESTATPTPSPSPTLPPLLLNISTKSSIEIYTGPTTSSERLIAANEGFSPHVVGVNADYSWVYIYFFVPERMQDGWIRSSRINLDETALNSLPIIDPENLPPLPVLEYSEQAVPVHLREAVIQATAEANTVREIYVVANVQWNQNPIVCASADGSVVREGDLVYFTFPTMAVTQDVASSVRWWVMVDGTPLAQDQFSYVIEENVEEASGEWTLPYVIWAYASWTARGGTHRIVAHGTGHGVRDVRCTIDVEPRPWMSTPTAVPSTD